MRVFFISPELTLLDFDRAKIFLNVCKSELENYLMDSVIVNHERQIPLVIGQFTENSLIIMFNNKENVYNGRLIDLIAKAKEKSAIIWPIALDRDCRKPMDCIQNVQSFEVWDQLRLRNLGDQNINTIALLFARKVISLAFPTLYSEDCLMFISHRRLDGEELTAKLCDKLNIQAKGTKNFRDVVNVQVGEEAQHVIDSTLGISDILVFLHTPLSGESKWVEKELRFSLLNNIPILWCQLDNADITRLAVRPGDKPHFSYNMQDFNDEAKLTTIVDDILHKSFELIIANSNNIFDQINTFKDFCSSQRLKFTEEDKIQMVYCLESPRKGFYYPQRDITQYLQYFGRRYNDLDLTRLSELLETKKHNNITLYDTAILLSNNVISQPRLSNKGIIEDNCDDFYFKWKEYINGIEFKNTYEIILSGSFPECDEIYKQSLTTAINLFSKEILKCGATLVFGSHPTFQNIIFEIGKKIRPNDYPDIIKMYISKWFQDHYVLSELSKNAQVCETEVVENDLLKSLTLMRARMISRTNVSALICLGGKTREGDISQGIDEEIRIAKMNKIPVFLVGSVGGRSSQLAVEYQLADKWNEINNAPKELNELLVYDLDYRRLANRVINFLRNSLS